MMSREDILKVVAEVERRWRERTPPRDITEVNASWKVGRGEIRRWCLDNNIKLDELDDDYNAEMLRMFVKLRREFPNETWDVYTSQTKELAKRYNIPLPRRRL